MDIKKRKSTAKKLLAGLVAFLLLILPIYATNSDNQQETLDIGASEQLTSLDDTTENADQLKADHQDNEDKVVPLGTSSIGEIEITAPNRKIPIGQTDFDLLYGVSATNKQGADVSGGLSLVDDGNFDGNTAGDYTIKYAIDIDGETAEAQRTITVTTYNVLAEDVYFKGDTMPLKPAEIEAGEEVSNDSLISGLSVMGEDGHDYSGYAVAVSSKMLNLQSSGVYTIDFNVVFNEEILVQFTRDFYVSTISTFASAIGTPLFQVGEKYPADHPTYPEEYKHIYYAVNADGRIYIGNREMGRESKAERQWFGGYNDSSALRVIRGGVETVYKLGDYVGTTSYSSVAVEKIDEQTIQVTYELIGASMKVVITYHLAKDARTVDYTWKVINNGADAEVKLYYGGDTYFAGSDYGQAFYNSRTKAVYVKTSVDPALYGMMILRASELTPLDYFFGGHYSLGRSLVNTATSPYQNLPGSHDNPVVNFDNTAFPLTPSTKPNIDQALYIQWNESLAAGATMTKEAVVQITEAGNIQVIAPEGKSAPSDVKLPYTFLLENVAAAEETCTFTVTSSNGWHVEIAGGSNTVTIAPAQSIPVTVYLSVPEGLANGTIDTLTLSVTSNRITSGSTITTIDNSLPAIQDIRIVSQSNTSLQAAVDFKNVTGTRSTTVTIFNEDGTPTSIPAQTKTIASGGTFDFDISGLTFNKNYIIRAEVVGIDYYSEKVFTITTIATDMTLNRGGVAAPANVNTNAAAGLTDNTVSATVLPAGVSNKTVNWTATPAGNATVTASTQSGANTAITFAKNGVTTITARAAAASNPSKSMTYTVDTQAPAIGTTTVTGSGSASNPFVLSTSATDPQKDGYASGLKNTYYKIQLSTAAAPTFNPASPTGWTVYAATPTSFQDSSGNTMAVYVCAVDNLGNYTIYKHTSSIVSDVIPPVITVSDIHVLQNATAPTFPRNATATDNIDGAIPLTTSHVDKTTVSTAVAGRHTIKYTVTDAASNTATKDQYVYVHGLPIVSTKVDTIELHVNDIAADFVALTDARVGVSAKGSTVSATGVVANDVSVTGITVTANNITFGTVGTYSVTYTATYPHVNGGLVATGTKTITVKISANPTVTPTTPIITAAAGTLRSFKDYAAHQITDATIKSNVTATGSAAVPTYTIIKSGGGTATLAEVNGATIASYIVRYRAENADGTTAYKDVPLYVYGKLTFTAPTNEHVLISATPLASKTLTVTFQGAEGGAVQTFNTAVVIKPANANISAVGRTAMPYSVKYPASFGVPIEETPSYDIFAHGLPIVSTKVDIIELHVNDIAADFVALTDARVGVSAKVSTVSATGVVANDVSVTGVTVTANNITFGTVGTYSVTYTGTYPHVNGGLVATGTKTITVKISANPTVTPTTPNITAAAGTLRSFKDYAAHQITDAKVKSNVTATGSAAVPTYTIIKSGGGTATLAEVNGTTIASYTVRYRAENADGTTAYKDVPLYVYGKLTFTAPTNEHVLISATPLASKTLTVTFQGAEGGAVQTFNTAVVIKPANANISAVGRTAMPYSVKYPASFGVPIEETPSYDIFAHGLPIVSTKVDTIELHVNDIAADFVALTDARVGVSAKVSTVSATGVVANDVSVTGVTVTANNITFGTVGTYSVTYTGTYPHVNGGLVATGTKTITVKVSANPTTTPTTPIITAAAGTLRSFKDYAAHQITDATIKSNVTATGSAAVPTYTILKSGGGTATLAEVNGATIASYTVRYRAENADGTTAYKDVPLYVYGKLTYTAPTNEQVLTSATALAPKTLSVTFQGAEGGAVQTFNTAVVTKPANANISAAGRTAMAYSVKYPASFGVPIEETPSYFIFAQGIPEISASNSVTLVLAETSADFNNKTDPRLALSAKVSVVNAGGTVSNITIPVSAVNFAGTITYGTEGIYPVTYTTAYVHPALSGGVAVTGNGLKNVNVIVTEFNPDGPGTTIDPTSPSVHDGKFWHFIGAGRDLTDGEIKSALKVTVKPPATSSTFTYKVISGSTTVPLATALGAPGTYSIAYRVTDDQNRTNTAYFDLYVVGAITPTNPTDVHTGTNTVALETNSYHPGSINASSGTFVSYDGTTKAAVVAVTPNSVPRTTPSVVALTYKLTYPTIFPAPTTHNLSKNSTVYVHGYPTITANNLTLSLFDTSLDVRNNVAIGLGATAKTPTNSTVTINKTEIQISYPDGPINFGTAGTYKVKLIASYQPHASMAALSTEKIITITISAAGNPDAPNFALSATGKDPIRYFQGFTDASNTVDDAKVRGNVSVTAQAGATTYTLSYVVLKADGSEITLANAKLAIGEYTIRYKAEDNLNRTSYFTVKLHIIGAITLGTTTPIETIQGGAGAKLPTADYTGAKGVSATFVDSDGTTKNAVVTIGDVTISAIETKNIIYTAKYPTSYNNTILEKTHTRIVRVHGLPVITASNRIDLRTGATDAELLNGITAQVSLAPIAVGGAAVTQMVPVTISTPQNLTAIGKFQLPLTATYTLPATYATPLMLTTTANNRMVVLHGRITYTGSDITLSTNFLMDDFEAVGRPQMNVAAKVSYYDTTTNTVVTDTLSPIVPSCTSINFGVACTNDQVYSVSDATAAKKPAGLSGVSKNKTFVVTIQDGVIGTAPVITAVNNPINWLSTAAVNKAELMNKVTANDAEDGSLTNAIGVVVKPSSGSAVTITAANTTLTAGLHTVVYTVLDSQGNKVVKEVPLYVYSPMTVTGTLADNNVRENTSQFKPDTSSWKLSYVDGTTGTTKVINSVSNSAIVGTTTATYTIATRGNYTYNVTAKHPIFGDTFTSFTGAITVPTAVSGTGALKVHTNIDLTGHDAYNATKVGGRATTSYFKVGQDVGDSKLLTGVTATYTNSDGNLISLTSTITTTAPSRSNSKANSFTVGYSVADDIITTNPKTTGTITVEVDSLPTISVVTTPVYLNAGGSEADAITIANATAVIYYGLKPDTAVTLPVSTAFTYQKGTDLSAAGNKATISATVVHPNDPSNTAKVDIPVKVYVKPSITLNGTGYLEMFKGEYTSAQILEKAFDAEAKFTDENGVVQSLVPEIDVTAKTFADSKRYDIPAYVIDPYTYKRIETPPAVILVLNRAYIVSREQYQIKNTKAGYGSAEIAAILDQMTYGMGEEVVDGQVVSRAFAVTSSTNQIKVSRFGVTYDLSRVTLNAHGKDQTIKILGTFAYRNQEISVDSALYLIKYNSSDGTNKPDVGTLPGKELGGGGNLSGGGTGTGGTGTGGTGTSGNLTGGGVDGNGDYGLTGEYNLSNGAITFWQESRKLIDKVGEKSETWIIKHSDPKNPTKNSGTRSKVIAVPGEYLEMPSYVINTLREQSAHRLQLNLGDYIWYLDSNAAWTNSGRTNYPLGVKASNNGKISKILGSDVENQQLTFGFLDGWNTMAHLGVKITNTNLQGDQLYMYYYNSYTSELEFVGDMEDLGSNWHSVAVKGHYGEYVITDQLLLNVRAVNMTVADNPSTGGYNYIVKYTHDMFEAGAISAPTSEQVGSTAGYNETTSDNTWIYFVLGTVGLTSAVMYVLRKRKEQDEQ